MAASVTKYIRVRKSTNTVIAELVQKASEQTQYDWRPADGTIAGMLLDIVAREESIKVLVEKIIAERVRIQAPNLGGGGKRSRPNIKEQARRAEPKRSKSTRSRLHRAPNLAE